MRGLPKPKYHFTCQLLSIKRGNMATGQKIRDVCCEEHLLSTRNSIAPFDGDVAKATQALATLFGAP
jgi:hypothetical protein